MPPAMATAMNAGTAAGESAVRLAFLSMLAPSEPVNEGFFESITCRHGSDTGFQPMVALTAQALPNASLASRRPRYRRPGMVEAGVTTVTGCLAIDRKGGTQPSVVDRLSHCFYKRKPFGRPVPFSPPYLSRSNC